jgi:hypothetical protein
LGRVERIKHARAAYCAGRTTEKAADYHYSPVNGTPQTAFCVSSAASVPIGDICEEGFVTAVS